MIGRHCRTLSEVQSREEGLKLNTLSEVKKCPFTFRSTIQRRRIETLFNFTGYSRFYHFQKYNPEKKDWNNNNDNETQDYTILSEVQSREEGLKLPVACVTSDVLASFRSTIQRRRIETWYIHRRRRIESGFQKYNPEKKDWNSISALCRMYCSQLSEVQSREEGLKHPFGYNLHCGCNAFRSTIQRRRIETKITGIKTKDQEIFQKYNPEKKDWNSCITPLYTCRFMLSEVQSREEGLKLAARPYIQSTTIAFRSTIQRRRIETRERLNLPALTYALSEVQSREEGLKRRSLLPLSGRPFTFRSTIQRRRIETWGRGVSSSTLRYLSEVQSREEGLKLFLFLYLFIRSAYFQKYNPEKKDWNQPRSAMGAAVQHFQKYNPEKKDWNYCPIIGQ